mmetsp:Transcript_11200/g.12824  ORF Transcript_11200/g.12824 Transcript_11200/m.12824 type:complete len:165 (-) Transcript_11200:224-718(-)|eukprot:CAMPEP_0194132512 /NCGR_PEP_ID=MMETSP0152-20130528/2961_1 /TAXON_ID=1049557 /ORGANISM="Thalassiothrix antarctica, Strain L6-D1" /LENGTH=164 /DNA_ID=CAMNT_0038827585 /DNA_START=159 /DNA_END=653 /DNA_ORIENTATION=-
MFKLSAVASILFLTLRPEVYGFIVPLKPSSTPLVLFSDKEGGAAIAKPKVGVKTTVKTTTKQKVASKAKVKVGDPVTRRQEEFCEAPMYKVMLIADDSYDTDHVIDRITRIMEDIDNDAAASIVDAAQAEGKAICGKYPMEHAEMYKEQLIRSDPMIFADIEDE